MGNLTSSDAGYTGYPPPGGYLVGNAPPQVPHMGYPPHPSGQQPPYGAPYRPGGAYTGGQPSPYGAQYAPGAAPAGPPLPQFPPNAVFEGQKQNKLKALWSKYTDQVPVQYAPEPEHPPPPPLPANPEPAPAVSPEKAPSPPAPLPPVLARDADHAKRLDAADGEADGKYFGAPIQVVPQPKQPQPAPEPPTPPRSPPPVEKVRYGRDRYGYDFPVLEEVVELSDHGRPLQGPVKRGTNTSASRDRAEYERDYDKSYDRAYDRARYNDREHGYDREQDHSHVGYSQGYYQADYGQAVYRPRPAGFEGGYDQHDLNYYGRRS